MLQDQRTGPEQTPLICTHRKQEEVNETAFTHGCISDARLRSDFSSNKIDAPNAAFRCRRSRLEMQQVGVDSNHLRAQSRCPLYLGELKSSGRPGTSVPIPDLDLLPVQAGVTDLHDARYWSYRRRQTERRRRRFRNRR